MQLLKIKNVATALAFLSVFFLNGIVFGQRTDAIKTKAGDLTIEKDEDSSTQVKIGKTILIESLAGTVSVEKLYPQKNPTLIVLSIIAGGLACAAEFRIIDVSKAKPLITDEFGNCNPAPRIIFQNQTITVKFPDGSKKPKNSYEYRYGAAETWQYARGKLKRLK